LFLNDFSHAEHIYVLTIEMTDKNTNTNKTVTNEISVAKFFDENGTLCTKPLYNHLVKVFSSVYQANDEKNNKSKRN